MRLGFFIAIILNLILCVPRPAAAGTLSVEGIRYGLNVGKTRVVIDLSGAADYRVFALGDPWRIVVDLPSARFAVSKSRSVSNATIKDYRSGMLDDGLTRIVFDLRRPAVLDQVFSLGGNGTLKDRLVMDLAPASENLFTARVGVIHGNKDLRGLGPAPTTSDFAGMQNETVRKAAPPERKPATAPEKYTIIIDAGHGGEDPGAQGAGSIKEKNITLAIAKELKRQLEETGRYRAVLTRSRDVFIRLRQRVEIARKEKGDLFVSIHADKIERTGVQGASIYTLSGTASDAETARLAEEENSAGIVAGVDLSAESQDVAGILLDLAMREKMNESNLLARFMEDAFRRESVKLLPNSHRSAGFAVLKAPDIPSVLIESGFLSNPEESRLLSSSAFQRRLSSAILQGIDAYFRKIKALEKI